jgi:hypothetical protein
MATTETRPQPAAGGRPGKWRGPTREYDLVKEFVIALVVVALLTAAFAAVFSSPDEKGITLQSWAKAAPGDFVATAAGELAGTTTSAGYGPPYNSASEGMSMGPIKLQKWAGVRIPVDSANDFVVGPLSRATNDPRVSAAVLLWRAATPEQQSAWATAYADALEAADNDPTQVASGDYGPVPIMATGLLAMADSGVLDSDLVDTGSGFFHTDYTRPLLFLGDGGYLEEVAGTHHLQGEQWGMMNETGNYPGQAWLWLYTFWYQIPPFTGAWADNADVIIWTLMILLSLILVFLPFIPGLRSIPRWIPLYRVIWRDYYRNAPHRGSSP